MKQSEIIELSDQELKERIGEQKRHLNQLIMNHAVNTLDNPMKIRHTRRIVARLMTEQRKRQINVALKPSGSDSK